MQIPGKELFDIKAKHLPVKIGLMSLVISLTNLLKTLITHVSLLNGLFCYQQKKKKGLDLSKTTPVDILFSGNLILSEYSFSKPNILDMGFLETGGAESSDGKKEKEVENNAMFGNLEVVKKKRRKKDIVIKQEELELFTEN